MIHPGMAIIMFDTTRDLGGGDVTIYRFNCRRVVTALEAEGVIPTLSTIPDPIVPVQGGERISGFNQATKAVAMVDRVALMDYCQAP